VASATETLWALSGCRFGLCEFTLRPCRRDCYDVRFYDDVGPPWTGARAYPQPALTGRQWFNLTCGSCSDCAGWVVSEALPPAPVRSIVEVRVAGTPLVTGASRVDNNRLLVRTDGGPWPRCNARTRADSEAGTWSVTA